MNHSLRSLCVAGLLGLMPFAMHALPAYPGLRALLQPDGTLIEVITTGDEYQHYLTTSDGYPILRGADGYFYYARLIDGELQQTNTRACGPTNRPVEHQTILTQLTRGGELTAAMAVSRTKKTKFSKMKIKPRGMTSEVGTISDSPVFPTIGKRKALAILVEFAPSGTDDGKFYFDAPKELISRMLNEEGFDFDGATGSVRDYYYDSSYGQFDLTFDVYGPVTLDNSVGYYGYDEDRDTWRMVVEACRKLDDEIDFAQYDQDGDGLIDNVYIFYAGENEADSGQPAHIWPHAGDLSILVPDANYEFDGKRLEHYACSNERAVRINTATHETRTMLAGIGNVCHEFTHVLGFPDLYNTVDQSASFTPCTWSVMDLGSYNNLSRTPPSFSVYERLSMGWLTPKELTKAEDVSLMPLAENEAYLIRTQNANEVFLLENRQQLGWDKYLPGHGMLIWHIAYDPTSWRDNTVNNVNEAQRVDLEEADSYRSYDSFAGDAFPGTANVRNFTDETSPGMLTLVGKKPTKCPLTDIRETDLGVIQFKVKGGYSEVGIPIIQPTTDITPISFTARWNTVGTATSYLISVWETNGEQQIPLEGYQEKSVSENSCTITGLKPETLYQFYVQAVDEVGAGAPSKRMNVQTPEASFAYIPPIALPAEEVTKTSFLARWKQLEEAESYIINVYNKQRGEAEKSTVDFTNGVTAMPDGWTANVNSTVATAGNFGQAPPALSLSKNGLYLQTPITQETVRGLEFWYKEANAPSGDNRMVILAMDENETWTEIDAVELPSPAEDGQIYSLEEEKIPEGTRSLKIVYELKGRGALRLDDVVFYYGDNLYDVPLEGWTNAPAGNGDYVKVGGLQAGTTYYYKVAGVKGEQTTVMSYEIAVMTVNPSNIEHSQTDSYGFNLNQNAGSLEIKSVNAAVYVYNALGLKVAVVPPNTYRTLHLTTGLYLITNGEKTTKLMVK